MKVSLNTIRGLNRRYGCADDIAPDGLDRLADKIGAQLGAVEAVSDIGQKYKGAVVVKILKCWEHPDSDHLHVCAIDDGGHTSGVNRDANGLIEVVCGAPNVQEGLTVVWLPPGATVPESYDREPFILETRAIRGVASNGMLASAKELALGDSHEGILEIPQDIPPGTSFADAYELNGDYLIDIENKMFTHRPDCFGFLGISRELAGIQQMRFNSPTWYTPQPEFPGIEANELPLRIQNQLSDLVPRFTAITMGQVIVKPSPVWLQVELSKVGLRPINNIVDYTNFFMLETGQPLHAYDYDKVAALSANQATLVIRNPNASEKLRLLNGKEVEPHKKAIMIATDKQLIGMGGVMGGGETEVDNNTKNIILECANFDMFNIRKTAMEHGIFTDAVTRFNKGQSPLQTLAVLAKIVDEIRKDAGGKVAGPVIDDNHLPAEMLDRKSMFPPVTVTTKFIASRLGLKLNDDQVAQLLMNVEFKVININGQLEVTAPFWRTDIEISEDIVEEVGRLYGYDKLPLDLPMRSLMPVTKNEQLELKQNIRERLARAGANELLTYSFVHGNLLDKAAQNKQMAFQLANALSPDLQYYRISLTPNLLDKVHLNIKAGYDQVALFEIGKIHMRGIVDPQEPTIPLEDSHIALVVASDNKLKSTGAPYYLARKYFEQIAPHLTGNLMPLTDFDFKDDEWGKQMAAPYVPEHSSIVVHNGMIWGVVGEFKPSVHRGFKLPANIAGFEVGLDILRSAGPRVYVPLPRFPKVRQDISLKVSMSTSYSTVYELLSKQLLSIDTTYATLEPLDIYQSETEHDYKHLTFRFSIAHYQKTLTSEEVNAMLDQAARVAHDKLGAERI